MRGHRERPSEEIDIEPRVAATEQTGRQERIARYAQEVLDLRRRTREEDRPMPSVTEAIERVLDGHNIEDPGRQVLYREIAGEIGAKGARARQQKKAAAETAWRESAIAGALRRQLEDEERAGDTWKETDIEE